MLIGLHGKAGSGKDSVAEYLVNYHQFVQFAFADPIKEALCIMLDIDIAALEEAGFKETPIPGVGKSLRELYQTLGTDWGRQMINENLWVRAMEKWVRLYAERDIVISDVRYENEARFIREQGGSVIHIRRPDAPLTRQHCSESGIEFLADDILVINDGDLLTLLNRFKTLLNTIATDKHTVYAHEQLSQTG